MRKGITVIHKLVFGEQSLKSLDAVALLLQVTLVETLKPGFFLYQATPEKFLLVAHRVLVLAGLIHPLRHIPSKEAQHHKY